MTNWQTCHAVKRLGHENILSSHKYEEELKMEPVDKPVKGYEYLCFFILDVVFFFFIQAGGYVFMVACFILATIVFLLSLFKLLFPPRISVTRSVFILASVISYLLLFEKSHV